LAFANPRSVGSVAAVIGKVSAFWEL
jgi:hypothetical protein